MPRDYLKKEAALVGLLLKAEERVVSLQELAQAGIKSPKYTVSRLRKKVATHDLPLTIEHGKRRLPARRKTKRSRR